MAIIRSWICENARCGEWFDSYEPNPECPKCRCARVSWRPNGGHIKGEATKTGDCEIRALADIFRMNDMNSAEAGRGAKKVSLPASPAPSGPVHTFGPGFSAAVNPAAGAQCVPTANKVDFKVKATPGNRLGPGALGMPAMNSHTAVEASHKG